MSERSSATRKSAAPAAVAGHPADYLTAAQAAGMLRIKPQTLYAYVSRGLIRRVRGGSREYLYLLEDVERLGQRGRSRAESGLIKAAAPHWAQPVVQTSITQIAAAGPTYRGRAALELAREGHRFENVAEMIWSGVLGDEPLAWDAARPTRPILAALDGLEPEQAPAPRDPLRRFSVLVALLAAQHPGAHDVRDGTTIGSARTILRLLAGTAGYLGEPGAFVPGRAGEPLAAHVARSLGRDGDAACADALNAALVLLADHQLTPPTVAARLAASSGATLAHCLSAALSVHSSARARRSCDRVEDLLLATEGDGAEFARQLERARAVAGSTPGFDHPLYPQGDPRAALLVELAETHMARTRRVRRLGAHLQQVQAAAGARPAMEAGLVLLCHALGLPRRSAGALLAIARCAGWVGHVIEQRTAGLMLRPRARYRG